MGSVAEKFLSQINTNSAEIVEIEPKEIREYGGENRQQIFSYSEERVQEIADSAKIIGILDPAIVRPDPDKVAKYELLAGRHRRKAAEILGIKLPCIIRDCDDLEASVIMASSNRQREARTIMEKAWTYRFEYELLKRQGERNDLAESDNKWSIDILAENADESKKTIQRLIRLTYLIQQLCEYVENNDKRLPRMAAVELSYLPSDEQSICWCLIALNNKTISVEKAKEIRTFFEHLDYDWKQVLGEVTITNLLIDKFFWEEDKLRKKKISISISDDIAALFPECADTKAKREHIISELLIRHKDELIDLLPEDDEI